jgi:hypothetical protein
MAVAVFCPAPARAKPLNEGPRSKWTIDVCQICRTAPSAVTVPIEVMCVAGAESLRIDGRLPEAATAYANLVKAFPKSPFRRFALARLYEIGDYWLNDTRWQMEMQKERRSEDDDHSWRWWSLAMYWYCFFNFDRSKPIVDQEGEALAIMETVFTVDPKGEHADAALFLAGAVFFFRTHYRDADRCFSSLVAARPHCALAGKAAELAVLSKHLSPGDANFKRRKADEIRDLVKTIQRDYPDVMERKKELFERIVRGGKE